MQVGEGSIRVGECLEISQVFHVGIFVRKESLALLQLLTDGVVAVTIRRIESLVVAKGASASADAAVTVRAGEPCVYGDLLYPKGELSAYPRAEIVVGQGVLFHVFLHARHVFRFLRQSYVLFRQPPNKRPPFRLSASFISSVRH